MTTVREVRDLVQPILAAEADVVLAKRNLVIRPVRHFVRAVHVGQLSSKENFRPVWIVFPLFHSRGTISLWGDWIYRRLPGTWKINDQTARVELMELLSGDVLPRLRAIRSLEDCHDAIMAMPLLPLRDVINSMLLEFVLGRVPPVETMAGLVARDIDQLSGYTHPGEDHQHLIARMQALLTALQADGHKGALRVLHAWERQLVEAEKLTPFWQPTPFPVEEMGLV